MIFGDLNYWEKEKKIYPEAIARALEYIKNTDFNTLENGRYEIDEDKIFVNLFETETIPFNDRKPETHKKYIDIQYSIVGNEIIGFARKNEEQKVVEDLLEKDDNAFYENDIKNEKQVEMNPGTFAIFFPQDVHRPACNCGENEKVRKIVAKVAVSLIK